MTAATINLEPHWPGMREWVRELAKTDEAKAREIAGAMGREAPAELVTDPEQHTAAVAWQVVELGATIEVTRPGVPDWHIPAVTQTATITADNLEAIRDDVLEQVTRGGATVRRLA